MKHKEPLSAFIVPLIFGLTMVTAVMLYIILPTEARKTVVIATEATTVEETLTEEETEPETAEIEEEDEQEASEESDVAYSIGTEVAVKKGYSSEDEATAENATAVQIEIEKAPSSVAADSESVRQSNGFRSYGIWSGAYWHFTPEEIDNRWAGLKPSKPKLPEGTTRAWQRYLYDKLVSIGAEHFYKIAVAQAMQESGFNPLNQMGNDSVPDKGLFSFRVWYWNSAYGDIYDYRANIDAYVARISPYLSDRSEQGIYRALSQHYQPDGAIHMDYVQYVLGRLNELWEAE